MPRSNFSPSSRARLTHHDLGRFSGSTLFDRVGRALCEAGCLPRKELFEAWEVARRARRVFRGGRVVDVAGGHGLLAHLMLLLDDSSASAVVIDPTPPSSALRVHAALLQAWPRLNERVTYVKGSLDDLKAERSDVVVSCHACGALTDQIIERAIAARARLAVLPCCHDDTACDTGDLTGWMDASLAIDAVRVSKLRAHGYKVRTQTIPAEITPKNRLILAEACRDAGPIIGRTSVCPGRLFMTRLRGLGVALLAGAAFAAVVAPTGRAQAGRGFTTNFTLKEFADRRSKIYEAIGPQAVAVMQGLPSVHSSAIFRQSNEFFYVSGVVAPQALLLMDGATKRTTLYLPKQNVSRAATEGEVLSSDDPVRTAKTTGVDEVKSPDQIEADLKARSGAKVVFLPFAPTEGASESPDGARRRTQDVAADPWDGRISREGHLRELVKTRVPALEIRDLSPILNTMREIKSPAEIALITRASRIGGEAIMEAMRSTVSGLAEFELDAAAQFIFIRHGAQGEAYRAIVASGPAAMNPHHRAGEKVMASGELVLMDYCPDLGYYRCDITRQWPVNGKFTPDQRDLYGLYLGVYEAVLNSIKPGITSQQVLQAALPAMDKVLASIKFSKPLYADAAKRFVDRYRTSAAGGRGGLGHAVGMATHDFGGGTGMMRPGMVFTIEPALTIPEEEIYIRLEDMILITPTGAEILSNFVPRGIAAVEKLVAEPGLLQQYGKIK